MLIHFLKYSRKLFSYKYMLHWFIHHYRTVWHPTCDAAMTQEKTDSKITLCASNPHHVTTNGACVWGFSTSRDSWMQILREWRVTRALYIIHLSHIRLAFSFFPSFFFVFFFQFYCQPYPSLFFLLRTLLISVPLARQTLTLNVFWYAPFILAFMA